MHSDHRLRTLVVDAGTVYRWKVRHRNRPGEPARTVLTLHRDGVRTRIVFEEGPGRVVTGGYWFQGLVGDADDNHLNLHRPGAVRAFVDETAHRRLLDRHADLDGWELLPAAAVRYAAAATPEAPPDCPRDP
ncbi:hypothetical protein [Streptomyces sp. NPDC093970]|uniref:hypothetical protein n=1 Tax=Streptomyces sp. NPDC093970 TaxID=3155076 RepID=UPI00342837FC